MRFSRRLSFFLFGIILGLFILWVSLKFREQPVKFNYLPNARVTNYILKNNLHISDSVKCKMFYYGLDSVLVRENIIQSKVDFKKSQIRNTICKKYYLRNNTVNFIIINCNDTFNLIDIIIEGNTCSTCN